jgi:hypothetical protein
MFKFQSLLIAISVLMLCGLLVIPVAAQDDPGVPVVADEVEQPAANTETLIDVARDFTESHGQAMGIIAFIIILAAKAIFPKAVIEADRISFIVYGLFGVAFILAALLGVGDHLETVANWLDEIGPALQQVILMIATAAGLHLGAKTLKVPVFSYSQGEKAFSLVKPAGDKSGGI